MIIKSTLGDFWEQKIFRYALLVHGFYFVLSIILFFNFFYGQNDFLVFYNAGRVFYNDINDLYNQENYLWNFRYFPLTAMIFVPFYLLGYDLGFIVFHFLNLFINILICVILYKIIRLVRGVDHEKNDNRVVSYISLYLMGLPHMFNYALGQINLYITLLTLLSLFIFLKYSQIRWQFVGSLILGFSLIIKPILIFVIPFLILLKYDLERKKLEFHLIKSVVRIIGVLIPLLLNFTVFILFPKLWTGFLKTNFTGVNPVDLNFSFSITKLIINFCYFYNIPFNQILIFIVVASIVGCLGMIIYIFRQVSENSIVIGFLFSILIMLLVYFDSWDHHLVILTPILIVIIFILPKQSEITRKYIKPSFLFFSFLDLAFMGIWFLTRSFFPFNFASTIFLVITFIGICKYCLIKKDN